MSRLLLYNPDNDLALASGLPHFTPPAIGRAMAEAGALLPLWWCEEGDEVLAHPKYISVAEQLKASHHLHGTIGYHHATAIEPWGWSPYTRTLLLRNGVEEALLPSPTAIEAMRSLSHRRTSIAIHRAMGTEENLIPVEAHTVEDALEACCRWENAVIKQPWSCSGRGVFFTRHTPQSALIERIASAIKRQQSLLIEPEYERTDEFAALYYADGERVEFRALSRTLADTGGAYLGNMVAPQPQLEALCGADAMATALKLGPVLEQIVGPHYRGWLGVDMLRHPGGINPCMELNLRATMGVVAYHLARRFEPGMLRIAAGPLPPEAIDLSPTGQHLKIIYQNELSSL